MKVIIAGCCGRMGRVLSRLVYASGDLDLVGGFEAAGHPEIDKNLGALCGFSGSDVVVSAGVEGVAVAWDVAIDFTAPVATLKLLETVVAKKNKIVIGTTGFTPEQMRQVLQAGEKVALVQAPNMSIGVNLLLLLVEQAAAVFRDADIEIVETHHRLKKDAPSGTALALANSVAAGQKLNLKEAMICGREGLVGERPAGQLGVFAVRGGDVVGDHEVRIYSSGERIELIHRAHSRETFASGALAAARFLQSQPNGFFTMQDVLSRRIDAS